jgi:hypothetical protein
MSTVSYNLMACISCLHSIQNWLVPSIRRDLLEFFFKKNTLQIKFIEEWSIEFHVQTHLYPLCLGWKQERLACWQSCGALCLPIVLNCLSNHILFPSLLLKNEKNFKCGSVEREANLTFIWTPVVCVPCCLYSNLFLMPPWTSRMFRRF